MNAGRDSLRGGYPLSTLFLLMAACAVVLGMISPLVRSRAVFGIGNQELAGAVAMGGLGLMVLGALLGLFHYRPISGALWGILVGFLAGILAGPLILVPPREFSAVMLSSLVGAAVILAIATILRLTTVRVGAPGRSGTLEAAGQSAKRHPLDPEPDERDAAREPPDSNRSPGRS